jgi:hypothetical protein
LAVAFGIAFFEVKRLVVVQPHKNDTDSAITAQTTRPSKNERGRRDVCMMPAIP